MRDPRDGRRTTIAIASLVIALVAAVAGTVAVRRAVAHMPALPGDGRLPAAIRAGRDADSASVSALDSMRAARADSAQQASYRPAGAPAAPSTPTVEVPTRRVPDDRAPDDRAPARAGRPR